MPIIRRGRIALRRLHAAMLTATRRRNPERSMGQYIELLSSNEHSASSADSESGPQSSKLALSDKMPLEVWQIINSHFSTADTCSLALASRGFYRYFSHMLTELKRADKAEQFDFLARFERPKRGHLCAWCVRFHQKPSLSTRLFNRKLHGNAPLRPEPCYDKAPQRLASINLFGGQRLVRYDLRLAMRAYRHEQSIRKTILELGIQHNGQRALEQPLFCCYL